MRAGAHARPLGSQNIAAVGTIPPPILAGHLSIQRCSRRRVPGPIAMHMMMQPVHLHVQGQIMRFPSALP